MAVPTLPPAFLHKAQRWALGLVGLTVAGLVAVTLWRSHGALQGSLPWEAIGILVAAAVAGNLLRFWRYHTTAQALRLHIPFWSLLFIHTVGYGLLPTPGKVGTVIRLWLMRQRHGLAYARTAPIFVMDLVTDALAIFALCAVALVALPPALNLRVAGLLLAVAMGLGVVGVLLAPTLLAGMLKLMYRLLGKRKKRLFGKVLRLMRTTRAVLGPRLLAITVAQSFVGWALIGLATAHFVSALGSPLGPAEGTAAATLSVIGGFVSLMPAGVGGAELSMAGVFSLFGVPLATALLATAVWRLAVTWLSVVIGLVLLPFALRVKG